VNAESAKLSLQKSENEVGENAPVGIYLVGAGVVGRAILQTHIDAGTSVWLVDQDEQALRLAVGGINWDCDAWTVSELQELGDSLLAMELRCLGDKGQCRPTMVIESIVEKLNVKQRFFAEVEQVFGADAVLCSNTSTLPISRIAESMQRPERFAGMHFFMPVHDRHAVELIAGHKTTPATTQACTDHVHQLGKKPLVVGDGPGFVVNRLLSPYLNEAMLMLCRGISAERIEKAALRYGMPMSPLELIDWIGTPTMFDAGRVFWQAFPKRLDPAPILVAMIKSNRLGRAVDAGFYDYVDGHRSEGLATRSSELCMEYCRSEWSLEDGQIMELLSIPMWIEAACAYKDGTVTSHDSFDLAMSGGLGYVPANSWHRFFESLGSARILHAIESWAEQTRAMNAPMTLRKLLRSSGPTQALIAYARG
jgi:3-hydroxyacyl-CoA dehydrogenase